MDCPRPEPDSFTLTDSSQRENEPGTDEISALDLPPITPEDLRKLGVASQQIPSLLSTISRAEQSSNGSSTLSREEAGHLMEILHKVHLPLRVRCFKILRKVAPAYVTLPKSYFPPGVTLAGTIPYVSGGFADTWKGQQGGSQVRVKVFRMQTATNPDEVKRVRANSPV